MFYLATYSNDESNETIEKILFSTPFNMESSANFERIIWMKVKKENISFKYVASGDQNDFIWFLKILPNRHAPVDLYIFTDGYIRKRDREIINYYLEDICLEIKTVHLNYIYNPRLGINLLFTNIFSGFTRKCYLRGIFYGKINSMYDFYVKRDIEGCIAHVLDDSYIQKPERDINKFNSLETPRRTKKYILDCNGLNYSTKDLTCDILFEQCEIACIPIKECHDTIYPIPKNPFKLLESKEYIEKILNSVEPYIMDYLNTYKKINLNVSPFTRDKLAGVYILHSAGIDLKDLIKHNDYILSTYFGNEMYENSVIWHIVYLYMIAMWKFEKIRDVLFKEIIFLGENVYKCRIFKNVNCLFWYVTNVCHRAFPNSKNNILRRACVSGVFLDFYQNVYDKDFKYPGDMYRWQLWYNLCVGELDILKILNFYFDCKESKYTKEIKLWNLLLNRKTKKVEFPKKFIFLSKLEFETILLIWYNFCKASNINNYQPLQFKKISKVTLHRSVMQEILC